MDKKQLKNARAELKAFYGAETECDWMMDTQSWSKGTRRFNEFEGALANRCPVAHGVYNIVVDAATKIAGLDKKVSAKDYYLEHREFLAEQIFNALERTIKD